ncbi:MAG TPA: NAD(P)-dependent oxidoreductase [Terriglobales bacterium]|nr:NAD(P)-dependent oxidoreductase [Terriglobales bacterium]
MKVFVAGATGVLGRSLVPKLVEAGHLPRVLVRNPARARELFGNLDVEIAEGDLLSAGMESALTDLMSGCDAVIHAATAIPKDFTAPDAWTQNTLLRVRGTGRLQRAALETGVHTFVQQSIVMAYPDGGDAWLDESTKIDDSPQRREVCQPVAIMEAIMHLFGRQPRPMRWIVLRCGIFVGPGTFQEGLLQRIREGKEIVPADGSHFVSLVHVDDVANAFVTALERGPAATTFHINASPMRYGEYVDCMAERIGAPRPPRDPNAPKPLSHRACNKLAEEVLGWKPERSVFPG